MDDIILRYSLKESRYAVSRAIGHLEGLSMNETSLAIKVLHNNTIQGLKGVSHILRVLHEREINKGNHEGDINER